MSLLANRQNFTTPIFSALIRTTGSPLSIDCSNGITVVPAQSVSNVQLDEEPLNSQTRSSSNSFSKPLVIIGDCYGLQPIGRYNAVSITEDKEKEQQ